MKQQSKRQNERKFSEEFERIMLNRTKHLREQCCTSPNHVYSHPLYIEDIRLSCCSDSKNATCKIQELENLLVLLDQAYMKISELEQQNVKLNNAQYEQHQQSQNLVEWPGSGEFSNTFPLPPIVQPFQEVFPSTSQITSQPIVHNHYHDHKTLNVTMIGNDVIKKRGPEILELACKGTNLFETTKKFLAQDPKNAGLLEFAEKNPVKFMKMVVEEVKDSVSELPENLKDDAKEGLKNLDSTLSNLEK